MRQDNAHPVYPSSHIHRTTCSSPAVALMLDGPGIQFVIVSQTKPLARLSHRPWAQRLVDNNVHHLA
jgi:hypothetical protein